MANSSNTSSRLPISCRRTTATLRSIFVEWVGEMFELKRQTHAVAEVPVHGRPHMRQPRYSDKRSPSRKNSSQPAPMHWNLGKATHHLQREKPVGRGIC